MHFIRCVSIVLSNAKSVTRERFACFATSATSVDHGYVATVPGSRRRLLAAMRDTRYASIAWVIAPPVTSRRFAFFVAPVFSAVRRSSVNQNSRIERFGFFNRGEQTQKLIVVSAARSQARNFRLAQLAAQDQIQKIVIVSRRLERKLSSVGCCLAVFRSESRQQIEDVVGCESSRFASKHDWHAQFKES